MQMKNEPCDYQKKPTAFKSPYAEKLEQKDEETTQMCVTTFFNSCRYAGPKTELKGEKEGNSTGRAFQWTSFLICLNCKTATHASRHQEVCNKMFSLPNTGHEIP